MVGDLFVNGGQPLASAEKISVTDVVMGDIMKEESSRPS